jgi:metal-sulfur cluster biosynthetic enzyme
MSISTVTVTWTEQDIGQAPLGGNITFTLNEPVSDATSGVDYRPVPKTYFFTSATGTSGALIANDDVTLQPAGSYYTITVAITGQAPYTFTSQILFANGGSQTLAFLQANAAVPAAQYQAYLPLPTGTPAAGQVPVVQADGSTQTAWGSGGGGGGGNVDSVTAADTSVVVGGTLSNPTVRTNTLDVIAADHPPAANWSNNSKKITSVANGSASTDAAAFGQIPTALPPDGTASGDLSGTYPGPSVAKIQGTAISSPPGGTTEFLRGDGTWAVPSGSGGAVSSVFGRTGAVAAQTGDYTAAQVGADASGAAAAAQAAAEAASDPAGSASTAQSNAETFATSAVGTETTRAEAAEALLAPKASPALTGSPTAPTQTTGDSSTKIATDAFVGSAVAAETARAEAAEALLAPLAGAAFTGPVSVTESAAAGGVLTVVNSHTTPASPTAGYIAQSAADLVLGVSVTGDTVPRLTIDSNGKLAWGPGGSTATDTDLYRNGVATLKTDGALQTGGTLNAANGSLVVSTGAAAFAYASSGGQAVKVTNTTTAPTNPTTQLVAKSAADATLGVQVTGDTQQRILVDSNGKHTWGSGSAAGDVVLQRSAAGVLQLTTGQFSMNSQKITSVANGTASTDAAAFGQIPAALPPNGAAGGVLSGSYPNPGFATTPLPESGGTMTGWLAPAVAALTFGTTIALNAALGNAFALTLTASTGTLSNPTNPVDGQTIRVRVIQDATGGRTLAFGTAYDFGAAGAPTLSTAASKVDILGFEYVASLSKWCYLGAGLGF